MKKTKETRIRQKMPKKLRFSRFFLRRLVPCVLAGGIVAAVRTSSAYHSYDYFDSYDNSLWDARFQKFLPDGWGDVQAEDTMNEYGIPVMLRNVTNMQSTAFYSPSPDADISVMLVRPDTLEYYISEPCVTLTSYQTKDGKQEQECCKFTADPEESERIMKACMDFYTEHCIQLEILDGLEYSYLSERIPVMDDFIYSLKYEPEPLLAYVKDDRFTAMDIGFAQSHKDITDYAVRGTDPGDGWRMLTNKIYPQKGDRYCYLKKEERPADTDTVSYFTFSGYPQDCRSGRLMQLIAAKLDQKKSSYAEQYQALEEVIADKSGKKLYQYYREAYDKQIKDIKNDEWDIQNGYMDSAEHTIEDISVKTPEEMLESLYTEFGRLPEETAKHSDTEFNTYRQSKHIRCFTKTNLVTLNGVKYYVFAALSCDVLSSIKPITVIYIIQSAIAAFLAALLWAMLSHLRARHKYEMDEYRRSLTAALAHDLKSPLTAISGYAENLDSGVRPEKQKHYTASILEGTQYMDNIITNALDLAKLEQNAKAKKQKIELIALLRGINANRQDEIENRALNVEITGSCTVHADPLMMAQALRNLLDNAVKFTPDGGSITVTGEGRTLRIVNDIAEDKVDHVEQLCEAFVKGDSARSNRRGTGLGLSVVRQIAELNKLQFGIESSGHKFTVQLREQPTLLRRIRSKKQN